MSMRDRLAEIEPEWVAAVADAGFEIRQVRFYPFPGDRSEAGNHAFYFTPGQQIYRDAQFPDDLGGQIADANENRDKHRIAAWIDTDVPVLGAKLRHELEHARQTDRFGTKLFDLNDLIAAVMSHKLRDLAGGGLTYNLNPIENDANAAAALFARARYGQGEALARLQLNNGEDAALFRSLTPPAPLDTIPCRMLAFLALYPDLCEMEAAARGRPFARLLDELWPGMGAAWTALQALEVPD